MVNVIKLKLILGLLVSSVWVTGASATDVCGDLDRFRDLCTYEALEDLASRDPRNQEYWEVATIGERIRMLMTFQVRMQSSQRTCELIVECDGLQPESREAVWLEGLRESTAINSEQLSYLQRLESGPVQDPESGWGPLYMDVPGIVIGLEYKWLITL